MIAIEPIGFVKNSRKEPTDDYWGGIISEIVIDNKYPEDCLKGAEKFSHFEIIFYFDKADESKTIIDAKRPRGNPDWPVTGIFVQRGKNRPNQLGATITKFIKKDGRSLFVEGLDAIDGTPVVDIKPVVKEFLPGGEVKQPKWTDELMSNYWSNSNDK